MSLLLLLLACGDEHSSPDPATEIGNPEMTATLRTTSSNPPWIATESGAVQALSSVWVFVEQVTLHGCEGATKTTPGGWFDLVSPEPVVWELAESSLCGLDLDLGASSAEGFDAPGELAVYAAGIDRLDRAFEVVERRADSTSISADALAADGTFFVVTFDLAAWLAELDLTAAVVDGDTLFLEGTDVTPAGSGELQGAVRLWVDVDANGAVDATDLPTDDGELPYLDADADGLHDDTEAALGTDPQGVDLDDDGLDDGEEHLIVGTSPTNPDTDEDGVDDGTEVDEGTDPLDGDSVDADGDGFDSSEDCDDDDPTVYPGAPDPGGDGIDQDCDGEDG
jgi:hypothetical protein